MVITTTKPHTAPEKLPRRKKVKAKSSKKSKAKKANASLTFAEMQHAVAHLERRAARREARTLAADPDAQKIVRTLTGGLDPTVARAASKAAIEMATDDRTTTSFSSASLSTSSVPSWVARLDDEQRAVVERSAAGLEGDRRDAFFAEIRRRLRAA